MDTLTQKKTQDFELPIVQSSLTGVYFPVPYENDGAVNYLPLKRMLDLTIASMILIAVLSWLYPLLYLLIRLSSPGGALFVQKRIGLNGKVFSCLKFRTMVLNDEADTAEARLNDARITPIGRFLRNSYIDELPQVVNVLMGDMSIVGPRPHMLYHHHKFCEEVPSYNNRHLVKPGITGLAQIKGYHGSISAPPLLFGRTRLDLFYVQRVSLKLDMFILFKTLFIIFPLKTARARK